MLLDYRFLPLGLGRVGREGVCVQGWCACTAVWCTPVATVVLPYLPPDLGAKDSGKDLHTINTQYLPSSQGGP